MGKSASHDYYVLAGPLAAVAYPQVWDNAASSAYTATWVSLHTADPSTGTQATSEASYSGYSRVSVTRSTVGWSVSTSGGNANPVSQLVFGLSVSTSTSTITHWSVGYSSAGATQFIYTGTVTPNISVQQNVIPILTTGSTISES